MKDNPAQDLSAYLNPKRGLAVYITFSQGVELGAAIAIGFFIVSLPFLCLFALFAT